MTLTTNARAMHQDSRNNPITNSHLLPKRMNDNIVGQIVDDFCLTPTFANHSVLAPIFGLVLSKNLDHFFHNYKLGLRWRATCHSFVDAAPGRIMTAFGNFPSPTVLPVLHGHQFTLSIFKIHLTASFVGTTL
ncbi:hypothetical protein B0H19DRAFT_1319054, partial [Mycena capillaripes]